MASCKTEIKYDQQEVKAESIEDILRAENRQSIQETQKEKSISLVFVQGLGFVLFRFVY